MNQQKGVTQLLADYIACGMRLRMNYFPIQDRYYWGQFNKTFTCVIYK